MPKKVWDDDMIEYIRHNLAFKTYEQIAKELGVTKSAVCGQVTYRELRKPLNVIKCICGGQAHYITEVERKQSDFREYYCHSCFCEILTKINTIIEVYEIEEDGDRFIKYRRGA
jgi:hypothetical protein